MKTIAEIHVMNLDALVAPFGSQRQFAIHLNKDPKQVNQWWGKGSARGIGPKIARELEAHFGKPVGWLDNDHSLLASQPVGFDAATILRTVELVRDALQEMGKPYAGPDHDPELFAEMLRLAILEKAETGYGERRVREAGGQGGGVTSTARKAKAGDAKGSTVGRKRVAAASGRG